MKTKNQSAKPEKSIISETARKLPVMAGYDVVVAGGGIAGVAAAVAAARSGVSVCLVDKACALGGLATLGNVIVWLPICDGRGRQVMAGLAEELLKLSVADLRRDNQSAHFCGIPPCWRSGGDVKERKNVRYRTEFNPAAYMFALEKLVVKSGIKLLYDTRVCGVRLQTGRISHLIVENKSGRNAIAGRTVIDATGDADICFMAGERTESLDSNVLAGWFYYLMDDGLHLDKLGPLYNPYGKKSGVRGPFFRGDDAEQVTAHILGTRELVRKRLAGLRVSHPRDDVQMFAPAVIACFRMTRRLVGSFSLGERHMHQWFDDGIGFTGDWRKAGPVYTVPLRALRGVRTRNLITAGRCISVDTTAWEVTRAIPTCALTGEAAGAAAALAVRRFNDDILSLSASALQRQLKRQGVLLNPELAAPALAT